jgi:hypothetical protein
MGDSIDIVFSFDTTGSMYPCLSQVRQNVESTARELFKTLSNLRIGIIAHGDWCDAGSTYVIRHLPLTNDAVEVVDFIRGVGKTYGGDAPECYELVLHDARTKMGWRSDAAKALVVIGDDVPHPPHYSMNTERINWRDELDNLLKLEVNVYGVHAMPGIRRHSKPFYVEIAKKTGGWYITLDQFYYITDVLKAITYKQAGGDQFENYTAQMRSRGVDSNLQRSVDAMMRSSEASLRDFEDVDVDETWDVERAHEYAAKKRRTTTGRPAGTEVAKDGLHPVPAGRFQVLKVEKDVTIRDFVEAQGIEFKPGRGFYLLEGQKKSPKVQQYKEIIIVDRVSGDVFNGAEVRKMLGLSPQVSSGGVTERLHPKSSEKYRVFVQSTSYNRKLIGGTDFLYEVPDWSTEG